MLLEDLGQALRAQRAVIQWLAVVFFVLALLGNLLILVGSVPDFTALWFGAVAALLPALCYSLLVLTIDRYEREPWRVVLGAFGWGAVVATLSSIIIGAVAGGLLSAAYGERTGALLVLINAPFIEETAKGVALLGLLVMFRDEFDNVLDGLVYGAIIGLGFAMTENMLHFGQAYREGGIAGLGEIFVARQLFGGFGHALYTATTGAAVGWTRGRHGKGRVRLVVPVIGWALAVFQHFLWNTGAVAIARVRGSDVSLWGVAVLETVVFVLPGLIVLYAIAAVARGRESRIIREQLAEEVHNGVLTRHEYDLLAHESLRRRASRTAFRWGGVRLWAIQQQFFQAAAELALCKYHRCEGESHDGADGCAPEEVYRARIAALRKKLSAVSRQLTANQSDPDD